MAAMLTLLRLLRPLLRLPRPLRPLLCLNLMIVPFVRPLSPGVCGACVVRLLPFVVSALPSRFPLLLLRRPLPFRWPLARVVRFLLVWCVHCVAALPPPVLPHAFVPCAWPARRAPVRASHGSRVPPRPLRLRPMSVCWFVLDCLLLRSLPFPRLRWLRCPVPPLCPLWLCRPWLLPRLWPLCRPVSPLLRRLCSVVLALSRLCAPAALRLCLCLWPSTLVPLACSSLPAFRVLSTLIRRLRVSGLLVWLAAVPYLSLVLPLSLSISHLCLLDVPLPSWLVALLPWCLVLRWTWLLARPSCVLLRRASLTLLGLTVMWL